MMLTRLVPSVVKEVRALLPVWLVSIVTVGTASALSAGGFHALGLLVFAAGCLALGALSVGHEYSHGTVALLLLQPVSRGRILAVKFAVLGAMLLTLAAAGSARVLHPWGDRSTVVWLVVLFGLFVAPLLTMVARNPLAGAVFSAALPGLVWIPIDLFVEAPLKGTLFWRVMLGLCAVAAVLQWRTFMRLEAIEGRGLQVHLPFADAARVAEPRRRHPMWVLVKKELGLQQLTFVVTAIYLLLWVRVATHIGSQDGDALTSVTVLYSGFLALLVGSMASAEERQFGTLQWQTLLPMASWKQWAIKAGTALALSVLLGFALPALLISASGRGIAMNEWYASTILLMTAGSLYVSSLSSSGLRAFLVSLSVPLLTIGIVSQFVRLLQSRLALAPIGAFVVLLLWFGMLNHRSAERGAWRVWRQVFVMAGCVALAGALLAI